MNLKKSVGIYILFVVVIFAFGSWAYNEVAVKNRPPSPDEIIEINNGGNNNLIISEGPLKKFTSEDKSISFEYPSEWEIEDEKKDIEKGDVVQSSIFTNYSKNTDVSGGFPENGVQVHILISEMNKDKNNDPLIQCGMKDEICESIELKGQSFKVSEGRLNTGFINKVIATKSGTKKIVITSVIATGTKQTENKEKVDSLINSISVDQ